MAVGEEFAFGKFRNLFGKRLVSVFVFRLFKIGATQLMFRFFAKRIAGFFGRGTELVGGDGEVVFLAVKSRVAHVETGFRSQGAFRELLGNLAELFNRQFAAVQRFE